MSRRVAVVTGSRADFGLLRSTMEAISAAPELDLQVVVAGAHLLPPDETIDEVRDCFEVDAVVEMQHAGRRGRTADATATGRGVVGFTAAFDRLDPDVVLVLGDRIEAFAAAASAGIGGRLVAHVHGGDRAEGVADESMRHAITKLAHLHFPATPTSGERIRRLGEPTDSVHVVGSPAADGIDVMHRSTMRCSIDSVVLAWRSSTMVPGSPRRPNEPGSRRRSTRVSGTVRSWSCVPITIPAATSWSRRVWRAQRGPASSGRVTFLGRRSSACSVVRRCSWATPVRDSSRRPSSDVRP